MCLWFCPQLRVNYYVPYVLKGIERILFHNLLVAHKDFSLISRSFKLNITNPKVIILFVSLQQKPLIRLNGNSIPIVIYYVA